MSKKLPKEIYVVWDEPGDGESYLLAAAKKFDHATMGVKKTVGTYRLITEEIVEGVAQVSRKRS